MKRLSTLLLVAIMFIILLPFNVGAQTNYDELLYPYYTSGGTKCVTGAGANPVGGAPTENLQQFVDKYGQFAYEESLTSGIPYDFTLAQAMVESGYGKSRLTSEANNFFGIKAGSSWTGATITMRTREVGAQGSYYVDAQFRAYPSPAEGFLDHSRFFYDNARYAEALKYPNDPYKFLEEIWKAGYATDPNYVTTVGGVIASTQEYIAANKPWPPSSEVAYSISPSFANPAINSSGGTSGNECDSPSGAEGVQKLVDVAEQELSKNPIEYDENVRKYTTNRTEAWCADFVSWVYKEAGMPFSGGGAGGWQYPSVRVLQGMFQNTEGYEYFGVGSKPPQPGDVAFYIGSQTPDGGSTSHVNIVVSVNGNEMTTIGGNESDMVKKGTRRVELGASSLVGFGRKI